jgi:hypothetical protein
MIPRSARRSSMNGRGTPAVTEVESIVEPDSLADDVGRESVAFVCIHCLIVPILVFNLAIPSSGTVRQF